MTQPLDRLLALRVGQTESLSRTITAEDVAAFARLSGDFNALHLDGEFAARTEFARPVVHGFLHASLLSTLIGMKLPGRGALYVSQSIEFTRPVFVGDSVEARATIEKIDAETRLVTLHTEIVNARDECVLRGTAQAKVLRLAEEREERPSERIATRGLLAGRTALVTGASRGIGRAVARLFAQEGATVWINYNKSETAAEGLAQEIASVGGSCRTIQADVTSEQDVARLLQSVTDAGDLHILVNNAGPKILSAPFESLAWNDVAGAFEQIVGSAFRVTRAALPALKATRGSIVTILSSAALGRTAHRWLPYVMGKSALLAMSKNLAQEVGPLGVTVNVISPSMVDTDLVAHVPDRVRREIVSRTPLRRLATPEDVAGAALLLASPYASFITGENLLVTGGEVMI
ncbi:MAG: SDR family oxidoreductase [Hyphomicrobium sp.]|uniref:SDR family oxidoreductase n=1 Tax=Hyphomicrobium sp. TaxID=82 RepID=UPI001328C040|nr:SDR family oxidoreductase [Hyphomicrobium sp.]KAB2943140.1 MAG: SDR family oxidoreductase [Hyphomicrobium sp.]MBZ0209034.1 SDR family oxidoreductase [Hyphomicrobium sp.]MCZ7594164.1 SDR family oxidoreductase [Hyphomicrobium sp.]